MDAQQQQLKLKSATVRKATKAAFLKMPHRFSALTLCLTARKELNNMTMDGTILRRLRELRTSGECVYKVVNSVDSIYEKVEVE
ncbi:MAG TPA: hypothetical protein VFM70_04435 [Salinimicrobium sp.]|nr:hypothetical protein [Salinimicrobium sp.]